jgi:hypothetical protein
MEGRVPSSDKVVNDKSASPPYGELRTQAMKDKVQGTVLSDLIWQAGFNSAFTCTVQAYITFHCHICCYYGLFSISSHRNMKGKVLFH